MKEETTKEETKEKTETKKGEWKGEGKDTRYRRGMKGEKGGGLFL